MSGVGIEETAAVGAELLDRLLARNRPQRDGLFGTFQRGCIDAAGESLRCRATK